MSGHSFGDAGAIALSRLIQQSHSLTAVEYDDNAVTVVGMLEEEKSFKAWGDQERSEQEFLTCFRFGKHCSRAQLPHPQH
jgi:hypothetical protein